MTRADLYPLMEQAAALRAEANAAGDAGAITKLKLIGASLVALDRRWRDAEAKGFTSAPFVRELEVAARQVALARVARNRAAESSARTTLTQTTEGQRRYITEVHEREAAPGVFDKLVATLREGGATVAILAAGALYLLLAQGSDQSWQRASRRTW